MEQHIHKIDLPVFDRRDVVEKFIMATTQHTKLSKREFELLTLLGVRGGELDKDMRRSLRVEMGISVFNFNNLVHALKRRGYLLVDPVTQKLRLWEQIPKNIDVLEIHFKTQ